MARSRKLTDLYSEKTSYVARDLIWKDHIGKIETAQKRHDKKWGYLNDLQPNASAYDTQQLTGNLLTNAFECKHKKEQSQQQETVSPSPRPIPTTSNKLIGWRTADKNCALEKYGNYARGQGSLHKKFKWPVEGFD